MCNAGLYANGYLCTSINILNLFIDYAIKNPNVSFQLYLNDYDVHKIKVLKEIISHYNLRLKNIKNLYIDIQCVDVTTYISTMGNYFSTIKDSMIILYVDPYKFGIEGLLLSIENFINKVYCELIFNYFSSDITRNLNNKSCPQKSEQIKGEIIGFIETSDDNSNLDALQLLYSIQTKLKGTKYIKYSYAYQFRTSTNIDLYNIVFCTPNKRGLELIKDSIWNVFQGNSYYKKEAKIKYECNIFGETEAELRLLGLAEKARKDIMYKFIGNKDYKFLEEWILENTLLKGTQIINNILKPLVENKKIKKCNLISKANWKKDTYVFPGVKHNDM